MKKSLQLWKKVVVCTDDNYSFCSFSCSVLGPSGLFSHMNFNAGHFKIKIEINFDFKELDSNLKECEHTREFTSYKLWIYYCMSRKHSHSKLTAVSDIKQSNLNLWQLSLPSAKTLSTANIDNCIVLIFKATMQTPPPLFDQPSGIIVMTFRYKYHKMYVHTIITIG